MTDPSLALGTALYNRLKNITYNGKPVPYYDILPENTADRYIYLQTQVNEDAGTKDSNDFDCKAVLGIGSLIDNNHPSRKIVDDIAASVLSELYASTLDLLPDFVIIVQQIKSISYAEGKKGRKTEIIKLLTMQYIIQEL